MKDFPDYTSTDLIGKTGLERQYERILRGHPGIVDIKRNAAGKIVDKQIIKEPEPGKSLQLWLDAELQAKAKEALEVTLKKVGSKKGAVIALDPNTGGVLAMVSIPSFDPNIFSRGITEEEFQKLQQDPNHPLFPRAIAGQYPSGSTIKPIIASSALQEGIIKPNDQLFAPLELCTKNIYSGQKECFADWTFHGWTDVRRAIAESINPFFYLIGGGYQKNEFSDPRLPDSFVGLGVSKIKKYLSMFGWGQKTGIDLPGEAEGRIPDPSWKENYFKDPQDKLWI